MLLATTEQQIHLHGGDRCLQHCLQPGDGFHHPRQVVEDAELDLLEKRAVLTAWASDMSAVRDEPTLRWLLGTPEPVAIADVLAALKLLNACEGRIA